VKLNLASGTDIRDGWINFDVVARWPLAKRGCDVIWDARKQFIPIDDGLADEIYAGYLLLHLPPRFHRRVLAEVHRVLKPSVGRLVVGEVDMEIVMRRFVAEPCDARLAELIWGEQGDQRQRSQPSFDENLVEFDKHCHGFTEGSLRSVLSEAGFAVCQRIRVHAPDVFYELTLECTRS
jgi:hypothetical protein